MACLLIEGKVEPLPVANAIKNLRTQVKTFHSKLENLSLASLSSLDLQTLDYAGKACKEQTALAFCENS